MTECVGAVFTSFVSGETLIDMFSLADETALDIMSILSRCSNPSGDTVAFTSTLVNVDKLWLFAVVLASCCTGFLFEDKLSFEDDPALAIRSTELPEESWVIEVLLGLPRWISMLALVDFVLGLLIIDELVRLKRVADDGVVSGSSVRRT